MNKNPPPQYFLTVLYRHTQPVKTKSNGLCQVVKDGFKEIWKVYFQISNIWKYEVIHVRLIFKKTDHYLEAYLLFMII